MKHLKSFGIALLWIALWALAAVLVGSSVILAGPLETAEALAVAVCRPAFWIAIGCTFGHIALGAVAACVLGVAAGAAAARWRAFEAFVGPAVQFVKSAPIVCFIVLLLVWFGSAWVDTAAVLLAVLPVYYFSTHEACLQRDRGLREMLEVFRVPRGLRLRLFEWPSVRPFFTQSTKVAVGMAWKSGVTAELIGLTFSSVGEQIYYSKIGLDTAGLLMWTVVIVVLGWACEKAVLFALGRIGAPSRVPERAPAAGAAASCAPAGIAVSRVSKSFGQRAVLSDFSLSCAPGTRTCLMAPTGTGKTTALRLVLGLDRPDAGAVSVEGGRAAAVFQECRLLPELSAARNVALVAGCPPARARALVAELIGDEACDKLPAELSGGMKRCVELCRALAAPVGAVCLDEPFAGLDDEARIRAYDVVNRELAGRTLLLVSHDASDAEALGCRIVRLSATDGMPAA